MVLGLGGLVWVLLTNRHVFRAISIRPAIDVHAHVIKATQQTEVKVLSGRKIHSQGHESEIDEMAEIKTSGYTIRYATEKDVSEILGMVKELAIYEKALDEVEATETALYNTLEFPTSADPAVRQKPGVAKTLLIIHHATSEDATPKEGVAGMALYFNNYSTWLAKAGIYLEDLFVRPEYRKKGYGKALIQALARECVANDWGRLEWSVLRWNKPSIDFYESEAIGAVSNRDEWEGMRVTGDGLKKLATTDSAGTTLSSFSTRA